jgi:cytochrome b subunit of formate dehydrogenase
MFVRRFTGSELAAHWVVALSVLAMIATGLALGIGIAHDAVFPVHVGSVFGLAAGLVVVAAAAAGAILRPSAASTPARRRTRSSSPCSC